VPLPGVAFPGGAAVKSMAEPGIGFVEAVELIQAHRVGSEYMAEVVLGNAVASCEHPLVVEPGYELLPLKDKRFNRDALRAYLIRHYPVVAKPKQGPKRKERNKQNRAKEAVSKLWPNGVPSELPNKALCNEVLAWLRKECTEHKRPMVYISDRTILRAAGRVKDN
jgi:hypothetical protein